MIAFGCAISEVEAYRRYAEPGIERARESDSAVFAFAAVDTVARSNNLLLAAAAREPALEALVLVHPHAEILDDRLCATLREAFRDPQVAIVGAAGAAATAPGDVPAAGAAAGSGPSLAWWQGRLAASDVRHRYSEFGGGELPAFGFADTVRPPLEVDAVDPFLVALSPWAVRHLRFDEQLVLGHSAEVDLCWQARAAGRSVMAAGIALREHRSVELVNDVHLWIEAHIELARKWTPAGEDPDSAQWRARARRAEAEHEATRAMAYFTRLAQDARIEALERDLAAATGTLSWRLTRPLRQVNHWRRMRAGGPARS